MATSAGYNFEFSIEFNGHLYLGQNPAIVVPQALAGQPNSLTLHWKNTGGLPVPLAYITAHTNPDNWSQLQMGNYYPNFAAASNGIASPPVVGVNTGDIISAVVEYQMPAWGSVRDLVFSGYAFDIPNPNFSNYAPVVFQDIHLRLSALVISPPGGGDNGAGFGIWPVVAGVGLLAALVLTEKDAK